MDILEKINVVGMKFKLDNKLFQSLIGTEYEDDAKQNIALWCIEEDQSTCRAECVQYLYTVCNRKLRRWLAKEINKNVIRFDKKNFNKINERLQYEIELEIGECCIAQLYANKLLDDYKNLVEKNNPYSVNIDGRLNDIKYYYSGYTLEQIAEIENVAIETIRHRIYDTLVQLRRIGSRSQRT